MSLTPVSEKTGDPNIRSGLRWTQGWFFSHFYILAAPICSSTLRIICVFLFLVHKYVVALSGNAIPFSFGQFVLTSQTSPRERVFNLGEEGRK
jgi:hypothetical protein